MDMENKSNEKNKQLSKIELLQKLSKHIKDNSCGDIGQNISCRHVLQF